MDKISNETIEYIGILSKLDIADNEKERLALDLEEMLRFFDKMNELNTDEVEPLNYPVYNTNVFREDEILNGDIREDILKNAPNVTDGMFSVPKTFN